LQDRAVGSALRHALHKSPSRFVSRFALSIVGNAVAYNWQSISDDFCHHERDCGAVLRYTYTDWFEPTTTAQNANYMSRSGIAIEHWYLYHWTAFSR
jgi:hypothetical protein